MHAAQKPKRKLKFVTLDTESSMSTLWRREEFLRICSKEELAEIPAKKWGDTEIAERGRSVLVMRARYRSAGLIPHQRGWTDAG